MVLLIIIPMKNGYFIGNINPTFSDKPIYSTSPGAPGGGPHWRLLRVAAGLRPHGLVAQGGRGAKAAERVLRAGGGGVSAERHVDPGALEYRRRGRRAPEMPILTYGFV